MPQRKQSPESAGVRSERIEKIVQKASVQIDRQQLLDQEAQDRLLKRQKPLTQTASTKRQN